MNKTESYALGYATGIEAKREYPNIKWWNLRSQAEQVYASIVGEYPTLDHDSFVLGFMNGYKGKR